MIVVRRLVPADVPVYRALMLEAYERHPEAFTSTAAERSALPLAWWDARVKTEEAPAEVVFGAFHGPDLAGAAGLSFETREKARHKGTLFGMYVPVAFRKLGIGRRLVTAALDHARSRSQVKVIQLTVTEGNAAAEALYADCGFIRFGVEPLAVALGTRYISKVHMWCDLGAAR
jgi:ribosomal protein S18 acetylase RimI-like enzyme